MTQQDVFNELNTLYGVATIDGDPYGAQCVPLVDHVAKWYGHPLPNVSYAKQLWTVAVDPWYQKIANGPVNFPEAGDLVIFGGTISAGNTGHCSVAKSGNNISFISLDQNWVNFNAAHGSPAAWVTHNYNSVLGWYRPQLSVAPVPSGGTLTVQSVMNVRTTPQILTNNIYETLQPGTVVNYTGTVIGDSVGGNNVWYHSAQGHFYWSGNVK